MVRCTFCGKPLTDPRSIAQEVGPECAGRQQALGAAVAALHGELTALHADALRDETVQRRVLGYVRALKRKDARQAERMVESAKRLAGLLPHGGVPCLLLG